MDIKLPVLDPEISSNYLKFLELMNSQGTLPSNISQHSDPSLFSGRSDKSEDISMEDELRDTSKFNKTLSSDPEENTESIVGLYTFSKDSSPNTSKVLDYSNSDYSSKNFTPDAKNTAEIQVHRNKDSVWDLSGEKTEGHLGRLRISELRCEEAMNTDRGTEKHEEISRLKKSMRSLQERQMRRESEMKKAIKIQESQIKALESTNLRLFQEINRSKMKCRRTSSDFNIQMIHDLQNSSISRDKIEQKTCNGKKELFYANGSRAEIFSNGYKVIYYSNRDIKQLYPDGKQIYFFSKEQTTKTTFPDGVQEIKFKNGQIEKYFPDKTKEIRFPDGRVKCIFADHEEETVFPNGDIEKLDRTGIKSIYYVSGEIKTIFANGEVHHGKLMLH